MFAAIPKVMLKLVKVAEVVVLAVCCKNNDVPLVTSCAYNTQPLGAAGNVITPFAAPPVPTTILNADELNAVIVGLVPKPDAIVGAVAETCNLPFIDTLVAFTVEGVVAPIVLLSMVAPVIVSEVNGGEKNTPPGPIRPKQLPEESNCAWTGTILVVETDATPLKFDIIILSFDQP